MPPKRQREISNSPDDAPVIDKQTQRTPRLDRLVRLFQQLTPFCAFCEARLTTIMTLQSIQSAIPEVTLEDLAAIKVIQPHFIHYSYTTTTPPVIQVQFGPPISLLANRAKHGLGKDAQGLQRHLVKPTTIVKTIQKNNTNFTKAVDKFVQRVRDQGKDIDNTLHEKMAQYILEPPPESSLITTVADADLHQQEEKPQEGDSKDESPCIETVLTDIKHQSFYHQQLEDAYQITLPAAHAQYGTLDKSFSEPICDLLKERQLQRLYVHQAEAMNGLHRGHHVIISTSTSSGKSLIYQLPILESLLQDPSARALFIFPTKALAQDQKRSLQDMILSLNCDIKVSTYDGDTPLDQRASIRSTANVILTNPDMLHYSILPNATKCWQPFFQSLKYVVIDEIHVYSGTFGVNMAFILRRLRRLAWEVFHNDRFQFISCSATLTQPELHMQKLLGVDNIMAIEKDGSPNAEKKLVLWNPPQLNPTQLTAPRRGAIAETADLLAYFVSQKIRTIVFCKIRKTCELLMKQMRENLEKKQQNDLLKKLHSYRGGYTPSTRRRIEQQMFRGELLAIIATNALELGIDIGSLDAVIMVGIPWSLSAFWQQSGRAGRRNRKSLTMVVVDQNPMDQHYKNHPEDLFEKRNMTPLTLDINQSKATLGDHLQCAADELPINAERDKHYFGPLLLPLCEEKLVFLPGLNIYRPHPSRSLNPSHFVTIRGMVEEETYAVVDVTNPQRKTLLEEIEASRAPFEIYEGAVFVHQGRTYLVEECNVDCRYAKVYLTRVDWITRQRDYTNINVLETKTKKRLRSNFVASGVVEKETVVFGYYKLDKRNRILDALEVNMDPVLSTCDGVWVNVPSQAVAHMETWEINTMAAIHAVGHLLISMIPKVTQSSYLGDIRTECKSPHATRHRPNQIVLYESSPNGMLHQVYDWFEPLLEASMERVDCCECTSGCPHCIYLSTCSEENLLCSKSGAKIILRSLLDMDFSNITPSPPGSPHEISSK